MGDRPRSVTILACVFIGAGAIGFVYHLSQFRASSNFTDTALIEFVRVLAVIAGVFMLRGRDWARWLALAWMAFHVVLSAFHSSGEFAMHAVFLALIGFFLLRADAARYFAA